MLEDLGAVPSAPVGSTMVGRASSLRALKQLQTWMRSPGKSVSILQGFSGVGKSWTTSTFAAEISQQVTVFIPEGSLGSFDVLIEIANEYEINGNLAMTSRTDGNLLRGLRDVLQSPGLLVIEDFQNLLGPDNMPPDDLFKALRQLSKNGGPGKVLLVTNQSLPEGNWEDDIMVQTFPDPSADEAVEVLDLLLARNDVSERLPQEQRKNVARWLGYNPRAMQILSACLRFDSLDDLIAFEPSAWEIQDQFLSQQLLDRLERRITQQVLARLDAPARLMLENLSALRRPFARAAIERQSAVVPDYQETKEHLVSLFILNLDPSGRFSVNSVARQVVRHRAEASASARRRVHRLAADYYCRHFSAVGDSGRFHGQEFVEARYHLLALGETQEFETLSRRFRARQIKHLERAAVSVPDDQERVTELLHTLAALLVDNTDPVPRLRLILAKLCVKRKLPGDEILALRQLRIITLTSYNAEAWNFYLRLLAEHEGLAAVARTARSAENSLGSVAAIKILTEAAQLIAKAGDLRRSIEVIRDVTDRPYVESSGDLVYAHQVLAGLMLRSDDYLAAMDKMSEFRSAFDTENPYYNRVVEAIGFPALARHDTSRLRRLMEDIPNHPRRINEKILCRSLLAQCANDYKGAAEILTMSNPDYIAATMQRVFCHLVEGEKEKADEALAQLRGRGSTTRTMNWIEAVVHLNCGREALAFESLRKMNPSTRRDENDPQLWLRCWDQVSSNVTDYPAFYFPRLPMKLTNLDRDLVRLEVMKSALQGVLVRPNPTTSQDDPPETAAPAAPGAGAPVASDPPGPVNVYINNLVNNLPVVTAYGGDEMSDNFTVNQTGDNNLVGAVGTGATASGLSQVSESASGESLGTADLAQLARQLESVVQTLGARAESEEQKADVELLENAREAAAEGNREGVGSFLSRLSGWGVPAATSVGTGLVTAVIRSATGV